jgi:hypothetical protein
LSDPSLSERPSANDGFQPHIRPYDPRNDEITRPGISSGFLRRNQIRRVDEIEAEALLGYKQPGILIPYPDLHGPKLMVNGRQFCRLRLDRPTSSVKYLSPKDGGAQLYVPAGPPFGKILTIAEGEFKTLSLNEADIRTVGIGGISSALPGGELLPALDKLLKKYNPHTLLFLGDADTALIFDFSLEAVKLAKVLPQCALELPRIPLGLLANGIDDVRESLGDAFPAFWEKIIGGAIKISPKTDPSILAAKLLIAELPAIKEFSDWQEHYLPRIIALGERLQPVALDELAQAVKKYLGINAGPFKQEVAKATHISVEPPNLPEIYFDGASYFRPDPSGFKHFGREDTILHLRSIGFPHRTAHNVELSPCEIALHRLQTEHRVDFAGPFCGRPPGFWQDGTTTILCTHGPSIIEPKQGDPTPINFLLTSLFGKGQDPYFNTQFLTFCGWIQHARCALRFHHQHLPGQALALVGPQDCGKSLLQSIITMFLGGRQADPSLALVKGSDFNSELWRAEHLRLGDEELVEDGRGGTRLLRERIKKLVTADLYPLHGKYKDAKNCRPIWRLSLSCNDDSESISVLPPPTDSFFDKIIYLQCYAPLAQYHDGSEEARNAFWRHLEDAAPAFLYELDNLELPDSLRASRFFVKEFHHPRVIDLLAGGSSVSSLGDLLLSVIKNNDGQPIEGTASEIYSNLWSSFGLLLKTYSNSAAHLGHQLARLQKLPSWKNLLSHSDRRIGPHRSHQRAWRISAPSDPQLNLH